MAKKKQDVGNLQLHNAADFYIVPLENDHYTLTDEALKRCVDPRTVKAHGWFYPTLKFISFKEGKLELSNTSNKVSYKLYIGVEKDKLHVSCSCGTQVDKLCLHAYKALDKLLSYSSTSYFEKYRPNGLAEVALANKKYFQLEYVGNGLVIKPKEELGTVYNLKEKITSGELDAVMALPTKPSSLNDKPKDVSICYIMMVSRRNNFLPFLIPCLGRLNKAATAIKGFNKFLSGVEKENEALLTNEQRVLNRVCLDMWRHVEKLGDIAIYKNMSEDDKHRLSILFELWLKAIHLLQKQYVFKHPFFYTRYLKGKPSKSYIEDIRICQEIPSIQFQLIDKGAFYQLEMKVLLNGKVLKNFEPIAAFFIQQEENIYMLSSQRDAAMSEWIRKSGERITIFKQHFTEFENSFLKLLRKYYSVEIVKPR
jgi:hypothetical protein